MIPFQVCLCNFGNSRAPHAALTRDSILSANPPVLSQKILSRSLQVAARSALLSQSSTSDQARLRATSAPHASAWLQAVPARALNQKMTHAEFLAAVQLWLGCSQMGVDSWCSKCDQLMDSQGFHVMTCMAGGDAVALHNALRDFIYAKACSAGLNPAREQSRILPDAPRRRPGDIVVPLWPGGAGAALDFAVTSPLQASMVTQAAQEPLAAAAAYEQMKRDDRNTQQLCSERGLQLIPMVVESFGGWGASGEKALKVIAHALAARRGMEVSSVASELYRGLGIIIMRAHARSLLTRCMDAPAVATTMRMRAQGLLAQTAEQSSPL